MAPSSSSSPPLGATDPARWRLKVSDGGRHLWHYLRDDAQCDAWPQTVEDKYWLGLETDLPDLPKANTPIQSASNGLAFYRHLQSNDGHWAGEYGGPMFLLPGLIIGMYVTKTPIPQEWKVEIARYLWHRADKSDGGWGIHIEGCSTVFGTALNYVVLRLVGVDPDHPMMVKARATLHKLGGATGIPSWGKLWLAILNVYEWEGMNPIPPELWLLPDWLPIHPWRWWIHTRMVYLPMGYLWGKRFKAEMDPLIASLRDELYVEPYDSINWPKQANNIAQVDIYAPHTRTLEALMAVVGTYDKCHIPPIRKAGIKRAYDLIVMEDENTGYQCLGPVNKMLNYITRWDVEGHDSHAMKMHREKLKDFAWMGAEGLMMTGTNGSQLWDTSFIAQAMVDSGLAQSEENKALTQHILDWLDQCQIQNNPKHFQSNYRFATKGAWPFSTKEQSYVVSDCTGEGLKAVIMLQQGVKSLTPKISPERMHDSIDLMLSMQNSNGGFASYETINGPSILEWLNPAEVFGDIMIEYAYPECTTSVVTALLKFRKIDTYRRQDIDNCVSKAVRYILAQQRPDGSWFGSWAICFTYATMFAVESLSLAGHTYENSDALKRACDFLISKQMDDGGWGETYKSCETGEYSHASKSQVVQTAWVVITLLHAKYPQHDRIKRAVRVIMDRQLPNGSWAQEQIEGIFNRNCAISYPNYKFSFTIWALGKAARELDWST
ncbi:putative lanosterol synthase [Testicularia cyperi]|uniref:Terpene cyclase/mutase family member n=1 Tax=Testicularia cyperi TaxID=1882483 RepID=A0A317XTI1_9BASI|nr:putative lanosterol synthase [Testicularia cyperi]